MLTKEQASAAADALTHQRGTAPTPGAPRNPFLLPAFVVLVGVASAVVGHLTGARPAWLGTAAMVVVFVVLMSRGKRK